MGAFGCVRHADAHCDCYEIGYVHGYAYGNDDRDCNQHAYPNGDGNPNADPHRNRHSHAAGL
jgi:hypothetical protein